MVSPVYRVCVPIRCGQSKALPSLPSAGAITSSKQGYSRNREWLEETIGKVSDNARRQGIQGGRRAGRGTRPPALCTRSVSVQARRPMLVFRS